ncbi:redoxin domain-containing protein [Tautonia marina]|uniref:redoxin domain-containing protein n=1 Tax=Tautonia marina TaxID=2653855 RepID=UPI0013764120|nr:redoxin domain-containing protein [Tautonia marina]
MDRLKFVTVVLGSSPRMAWTGPVLAVLLLGLVGGDRVQAGASDVPLTVAGLDGREIPLLAPDRGTTVAVFYSTECPIANALCPALADIAGAFPADRINLVAICVQAQLDEHQIREHARQYGLDTFRLARDHRGVVAELMGATVTPEAFVIDDKGTIRYQGRIDDSYAAPGIKRAVPRSQDLRDAIAAVLEGDQVAELYVEPVGCPMPVPPSPPTYTEHVAPILFANCTECHRPGEIGPFPLLTYEQARIRAGFLADITLDRRMPPWSATPGFGPAFAHDRSLSSEEIETLVAWADADAPHGPGPEPEPPTFSDAEWTYGTPDIILDLPEFEIPAGGYDIYRCFVLPSGLVEDTEVKVVEYQPGNPRVVHHMLGYVDTTGRARQLDEEEDGPGYTCFGGPRVQVASGLAGWAPGVEPEDYGEGIGRRIPKGSDIVVQVHYHPSGKPETDRSRIGLYLARKPLERIVASNMAINRNFYIPAGEPNQEVTAEWVVPEVDLEIVSVTPHMHQIGRDMTMTVDLPDGSTQELIKIARWDFNWQSIYVLEEPMPLPVGSRVKLVAHFDNSAENPWNPNDPPEPMFWGEATTEEMCIGFVGVVKADQDLTRGDPDDLGEIFGRQWEQRAKDAKPDRERIEAIKAELHARRETEPEAPAAADDLRDD